MQKTISDIVQSKTFETAVMALIVANAITLGLETSDTVMAKWSATLFILDRLFLAIFTLEIVLRMLAFRTAYPRDPWRVFDFAVVAISWLPATGAFSVLRALRVLRVLRLLGMVPTLRRVVGGLLAALPGMGAIIGLLAIVFYVFSVMATKLFGNAFPEWFGSLGASAYSLFQIMTLESWSMGIVRPVMEQYPYAWAFFIPFIMATTFTVLNLFIGIIVSAMQAEHEETAAQERETLHNDQEIILAQIRLLNDKIDTLSKVVADSRR